MTLNTLRSRTKRIFTELDVTSRRAAVRLARERGLLSAAGRRVSPRQSHHVVMPGHQIRP